MSEKCPKCGSTETEGQEMADYIADGEPVKYLGETKPSWYECKICEWTWKAGE